jgi:hypothetical protein
MTIKASGRSALIIAAGIWACFSGPLQAAEGADSATPTASKASSKAVGAPIVLKKYTKSRHEKNAQRKSSKAALKSDTSETDSAAKDGDSSTAIPPSVANANAELAPSEAPPDSARAMSAKANTMLVIAADKAADAQPTAETPAETPVVAADQLNDLDRALEERTPAAPPLAMASAEPPAAPAAPVVASSKEDSAWDQTSLIGKIFIGFGALLTMASAARMFMA